MAITTMAIAIEYVAFIFFPVWIYRKLGNIVAQHRLQKQYSAQ
jgi:hypothetical protein